MPSFEILSILFTFVIALVLKRIFFSSPSTNDTQVTVESKRDDTSEITKAGGLVEYIKREHKKQGALVEFYMGEGNRFVSINDPNYIKQITKLGSRPVQLFDFIVPLFGKDNLQIYSADRASKLRKLITNAFGTQRILF